jgi:hypothetical protein
MAGALGTASQALLGEVEALFRSGTSMSLQRITGANSGLVDTDAASFWDEGFEAVVLSSPGWDLDEAWHTAADTWDRLDYPRMADLTDGVAAAVRGL